MIDISCTPGMILVEVVVVPTVIIKTWSLGIFNVICLSIYIDYNITTINHI